MRIYQSVFLRKSLWNFRYHWKRALLSVGLLIGGAVILTASTHTVTCADWDERYFHWSTTAQLVEKCLATGQVDANQVDEERRTLLHRVVMDITEEGAWDETDRAERHVMIATLLRQPSVNVNAVDASDRTPLHYALKKSDAWSVAALLLDAGANPIATTRSKRRIEEQWVPVLGLLQRHASKDITDLIPSQLLGCQKADCIIDSLLKDTE